jgi:hypothetical protein
MGTAERSKKEPHDGGHNSRADKTEILAYFYLMRLLG